MHGDANQCISMYRNAPTSKHVTEGLTPSRIAPLMQKNEQNVRTEHEVTDQKNSCMRAWTPPMLSVRRPLRQ